MGSGSGRRDFSPYLGIHTDADGLRYSVELLERLLEACSTSRNGFNDAPFLFKSNGMDLAAPEALARAMRRRAAALHAQVVVNINPFTDGPGSSESEVAVLAQCDAAIALYQAENPILTYFNHNSVTWSGTDEEYFALEAKVLKRIQDAGMRWAVVDDKGPSWLATNITDRLAAWASEGVNPALCEFLGTHVYVADKHVPVHLLLLRESLDRAGVSTEVWCTECAWDFIHSNAEPPGNTRGGRPDLFTSPATDWTALMFRWHRAKGITMLYFDMPLLFASPGSAQSSLGALYTFDQDERPPYVELPPAAVPAYQAADAAARAYTLALSNGGSEAAANAAAARVQAGYVCEL